MQTSLRLVFMVLAAVIYLFSFGAGAAGNENQKQGDCSDPKKAGALTTMITTQLNGLGFSLETDGRDKFSLMVRQNLATYCGSPAPSDSNFDDPVKACKEAVKSFKEKVDEFKKSAAEAEAGADPYVTAIKCLGCSRAAKGEYPDYCEEKGINLDKKAQAEATKLTRAQKNLPQESRTSVEENRVNYTSIMSCPPIAAENLKEVREDMKKAKEEAKSNEEDLNVLTEKLNAQNRKLSEARGEYDTEVKKADDEKDKQLETLLDKTSEKTKALNAEYDKASQEITQIMELIVPQLQEAERAKLAAADLKCEGYANQKLEEFLKERKGLLGSNTASAGTLLNLARQTGPSRKEKNASTANKYFDSCRGSGSYKAEVLLIENEFKLKMDQENTKIKILQSAMLKASQEMQGSDRQNEYQKKYNEVLKVHKSKMDQLQRDLAISSKSRNDEIEQLTRQIAKLKLKITENQSRTAMMLALYSAAKTSAGGSTSKEGAQKTFTANFANLKLVADVTKDKCMCLTAKSDKEIEAAKLAAEAQAKIAADLASKAAESKPGAKNSKGTKVDKNKPAAKAQDTTSASATPVVPEPKPLDPTTCAEAIKVHCATDYQNSSRENCQSEGSKEYLKNLNKTAEAD